MYSRYGYLATVTLGAGAEKNGSNATDMKMVIDTRSEWSYVFDSNCTTCNNTNKYAMHPNATKTNDVPVSKIKHVDIVSSYAINDTMCVKDNSGGGNGNPKCSENRKFAVITDQKNHIVQTIDGLLGFARGTNL